MKCTKSSIRVPVLAALVAVVAASPAAAEEPRAFTLHRLAEGVYGAVARPGGGAGGNAGFVIGEDGVAVIDTFQSADAARELLAAIRELTPLPVRHAINTHYHLDHVTGNEVLREAGAVVLAQRNVRAWARTENLKWWGDDVPAAARERVESIVLPELLYDAGVDLVLGRRTLLVRSLPGHTGSDSIVVVPDADVVFGGDLFWNRTVPNTTDADTEAWLATLRRLAAEHPQDTLLPGHGQPGRADDVLAFAGYLETLREQVARAIADGRSGEALVEQVLPVLSETYSEWGFFEHFARANVTQAEAEQRGTKRRPQ